MIKYHTWLATFNDSSHHYATSKIFEATSEQKVWDQIQQFASQKNLIVDDVILNCECDSCDQHN